MIYDDFLSQLGMFVSDNCF